MELSRLIIEALAGTSGEPKAGNEYVTDADSRLADSRAPSGTAGGDLSGTYPNPSVANDSHDHSYLTLGAMARYLAGDYVGDGTEGRNITVGYVPTLVIVWRYGGSPGIAQLCVSMSTAGAVMIHNTSDSSGTFKGGGTTRVKIHASNGFVVGGGSEDESSFNVTGVTYKYRVFA